MLRLAHLLLVSLYAVVPALTLARALRARRRGQKFPLTSLGLSAIFGFTVALALCITYATATSGRVRGGQVLIGSYFATALLLLLKAFDAGIRIAFQWLFRLRPASATAPRGRRAPGRIARLAAAGGLRVIVLFGLGLPYVIAVAMIYRPKVSPLDDPQVQLGFPFERVEFESTDGLKLIGWWIPALRPRRAADPWSEWGDNTVLVCHGLGASKSNQLILARRLVPGGFNVLAFDFRAHGESGGQITTFGDLERRDVLGAVRWVRAARPERSKKIYGVGASLGAAALISAAADASDEGRAIDAIAAYGAYDRLGSLSRSIAGDYFLPPLDWLLVHISVPLASVQTGVNLAAYAPADDVQALWPRPILIIHGQKDEFIDFQHAEALYRSASQPKYHLWLEQGNHDDIVGNETAARIVLEFFRSAAGPVPVI